MKPLLAFLATILILFIGRAWSEAIPDLEKLLDLSNIHTDFSAQKFLGGEFPAKFPVQLLSSPLKAPAIIEPFTETLIQSARSQSFSPSVLLGVAASFLDRPLYRFRDRSALSSWIEESKNPENLHLLLKGIKGRVKEGKLTLLPDDVNQALYVILASQLSANQWVNIAQESTVRDILARLWSMKRIFQFNPPAGSFKERIDFRIFTKALQEFNLTPIVLAAYDILYAMEWAGHKLTRHQSYKNFGVLRIETIYGTIEVGDRSTQTYGAGNSFLIIDLGGDDIYHQAGTNDPALQATAVSLDMDGNDSYAVIAPGLGVGTLGIGILWDDSGNDSYSGVERTSGSATLGVGILLDREGNDHYSAEFESQASALGGIGILADGSGDDLYESFSYSQSYAGPAAVSLLVDSAGADRYLCNDKEIRYPASQDKTHNISMGQAAGSGIRPFKKGAINLPGGTALLFDGSGDDHYEGGVFAQGVGLWYGAGVLVDGKGSDSFKAHWYAQGSAAHFGAGFLWDRSGNDSYELGAQMGLGAGHDLGAGILLDDSGDDSYTAKRLALGSSNDSGIGIFIDLAGADSYSVAGKERVGWVNPIKALDPREQVERWAVFYDPEEAEIAH